MGADGVPEYRDAKDWTGWPPLDSPDIWEDDTIEQARAQVDAVEPHGGRVVWEVSSPEKAEALSKLFGDKGIKIEVRYVP